MKQLLADYHAMVIGKYTISRLRGENTIKLKFRMGGVPRTTLNTFPLNQMATYVFVNPIFPKRGDCFILQDKYWTFLY